MYDHVKAHRHRSATTPTNLTGSARTEGTR
jgi:hypothetical protein